MPEHTAALVDVSGLTLDDLDGLGDVVVAQALRDVLSPASGDTEVVAGFDNS